MNAPSQLGPPRAVLVRYGELALKGGNRGEFEGALVRGIRRACEGVAELASIDRERGRILVFPKERVDTVAQRLQRVFGISSVSPAWSAEPNAEAIAVLARAVLEDALADVPPGERRTFRVRSTRADKRFALKSDELDRYIAERIVRATDPLRVQLKDPELTLGIEVRSDHAWVFAQRYPGPGGLPVGTLGRVLCLISGGIDSPVAAWLSMKRGCQVTFVTFHSHPFIGESAKKKVVDLVRVLAPWQGPSRLVVVPFAQVQLAIRALGRASYRTVLYRRMMQRIASRVAADERALALVTGECLGQVASQTLENLTCIGAAASLPVLRPLLTYDKNETIEIARRIGTFDLSSIQEPDCCTLFMPDAPVIRGKLEVCEEAESRLEMETLVAQAFAGAERIDVS